MAILFVSKELSHSANDSILCVIVLIQPCENRGVYLLNAIVSSLRHN